ncbi:MAG: LemA family protein [Gemmatimonadales bacterium]
MHPVRADNVVLFDDDVYEELAVPTIIFTILLIVSVFWAIGAYNKIIQLKGETLNAWKQIDVQLKRRHDLIPNLVNAVKGAMDFEKDTLEAVIQARNQAVSIQGSAGPAGGIKELAAAETALSGALSRFNLVVERYPDLKATTNVGQLQEELTSTENRISFARQHYNDSATTYNVKQQQFPWNMIAGFAKAEQVELWEITDDAERKVPTVDLS